MFVTFTMTQPLFAVIGTQRAHAQVRLLPPHNIFQAVHADKRMMNFTIAGTQVCYSTTNIICATDTTPMQLIVYFYIVHSLRGGALLWPWPVL